MRWPDSARAWTNVGLLQHREVSYTDLQRSVPAIQGLLLRDDAAWKQVGTFSQPYAPIQKFHLRGVTVQRTERWCMSPVAIRSDLPISV